MASGLLPGSSGAFLGSELELLLTLLVLVTLVMAGSRLVMVVI